MLVTIHWKLSQDTIAIEGLVKQPILATRIDDFYVLKG